MNINDINNSLIDLREDNSLPRNIKEKIEEIITILNTSTDSSIKVNKALDILEDVADDTNIEPYTRTQVWNVASLLEKL